MIRMITGTIAVLEPGKIIIQTASGVGYIISTLPSFAPLLEHEVTLYTYLAVRDTALDLYGFTSLRELSFFELLLTIPKVGPKTALQLLGQADIRIIRKAIVSEDPNYLATMSDMSKKNAEKVVHTLKGKLSDEQLLEEVTANENLLPQTFTEEIVEALISLGYTPKDARDIVRELPDDITDVQTGIRIALTSLSIQKGR